jgi:hypothetical protein
VGKASFEVVRQVLIDIREWTGCAKNKMWAGWGWSELETYTTMEELGEGLELGTQTSRKDYGVRVEAGKLIEIDLNFHNITGTLPHSLAKLDTLEVLRLWSRTHNDLGGFLPAHMGSASCLPSLKILDVRDNRRLGGVLDARFLASCEACFTDVYKRNQGYTARLNHGYSEDEIKAACNLQLLRTCIANCCSNVIDYTACYCRDPATCMVVGCLNTIDETVCGSGFTARSTSTIRWGMHRSRWRGRC